MPRGPEFPPPPKPKSALSANEGDRAADIFRDTIGPVAVSRREAIERAMQANTLHAGKMPEEKEYNPLPEEGTHTETDLEKTKPKDTLRDKAMRFAGTAVLNAREKRRKSAEHSWQDRIDTIKSTAEFNGIKWDSDTAALERLLKDYNAVDSDETRDLIQGRMDQIYDRIMTQSESINRMHGAELQELVADKDDKSNPLEERTFNAVDPFFVKKRDEAVARRRRAAEPASQTRVEVPAVDVSAPAEDLKDLSKSELRTRMRDTVGQLSQLADLNVSPEKQEMDEKASIYLAAYKDFHAKHNKLMRGVKLNTNSSESHELAELKAAYDESRLAYANKIEVTSRSLAHETPESALNAAYIKIVQERFDARIKKSGSQADIENLNNQTVEYYKKFDEFLDRANIDRLNRKYESIGAMTRFKEVIKPAAEKKIEAREQALGEKGLISLEKIGISLKNWNDKQEEKYGKAGWKARRIIITAAAATGGALATGAVAATGGVGLAAAILGFAGVKVTKSLAGIKIGAYTGGLSGAFFNRRARKTQAASKESLKRFGKSDSLTSTQDLDRFDAEREAKLINAKDSTVAKKTMLAAAIGGFIGGAGTTSLLSMADLLHHLPSIQHTLDAVPNNDAPSTLDPNFDHPNTFDPMTGIETPQVENVGFPGLHDVDPAGGDLGLSDLHQPGGYALDHENITVIHLDHASTVNGHETGPLETNHAQANHVETSHAHVEAKIEGKVNNADKLFGQLVTKLHEQYPDRSTAPASVQRLFDIDGKQDHLTTALHLQDAQGNSIVMHHGDYVSLDDDKVVLHRVGRGPLEIINQNGEVQNNISTSELRPKLELDGATNSKVILPEAQHTDVSVNSENALNMGANATNTQELNHEQLNHTNLEANNTHHEYSFENLNMDPKVDVDYDLHTNSIPVEVTDHDSVPNISSSNSSEIVVSAHEIFKNTHGVRIDPNVANLYTWRVPGTKLNYPVLFGSDDVSRSKIADAFILKNRNVQGVLTTITDPITKQTHLQMHALSNGLPVVPVGDVIADGKVLNIPDPKDFIKLSKI